MKLKAFNLVACLCVISTSAYSATADNNVKNIDYNQINRVCFNNINVKSLYISIVTTTSSKLNTTFLLEPNPIPICDTVHVDYLGELLGKTTDGTWAFIDKIVVASQEEADPGKYTDYFHNPRPYYYMNLNNIVFHCSQYAVPSCPGGNDEIEMFKDSDNLDSYRVNKVNLPNLGRIYISTYYTLSTTVQGKYDATITFNQN